VKFHDGTNGGDWFNASHDAGSGGSNALIPLVCALQLGLPVVDGDGMGRAFPELQMDSFAILGCRATRSRSATCTATP